MQQAESPQIYPLHERELLRSTRLGYMAAMSCLNPSKGGTWVLRKLKTAYSGAGRYHYCLYDGERGFHQVTDVIVNQIREVLSDEQLGLDESDPLALDNAMLLLEVPKHMEEEVKALGATWLPTFRRRGCMPIETATFSRWLMHPQVVVRSAEDLVRLKVPRVDSNRAKAVGAFWTDGQLGAGWHGLRAHRSRFAEWL